MNMSISIFYKRLNVREDGVGQATPQIPETPHGKVVTDR